MRLARGNQWRCWLAEETVFLEFRIGTIARWRGYDDRQAWRMVRTAWKALDFAAAVAEGLPAHLGRLLVRALVHRALLIHFPPPLPEADVGKAGRCDEDPETKIRCFWCGSRSGLVFSQSDSRGRVLACCWGCVMKTEHKSGR